MNRASPGGKFYVSVSTIDSSDRHFAVSPAWMDAPPLLRSVREVGILSPLRLERIERDRYRVVSGFRRLRAAIQAGLEEVPAVLVDPLSDEDLLIQTIWENLGTRSLSLVEKAFLLRRLERDFGIAESRLIGEFLPALDVHPNRRNLQRLLKLASLPEHLQREIPGLQTEIALGLSSWNLEEQDLYLQIYRKCRPGKNKQGKLFDMLDELRAALPRDRRTGGLPGVWREMDLEGLLEDERLGPADRFDRILGRVWQSRFPILAEHQEKARGLKTRLQIPPGVQFHLPPNLEGSRIFVQFSFRDPGELEGSARKLLEISGSVELRELLDLL